MPQQEQQQQEQPRSKSLSERMKEIEASSFRNEQAIQVQGLIHENKRLRDNIGRSRRAEQSSAPKIVGLATLGSKPSLPK